MRAPPLGPYLILITSLKLSLQNSPDEGSGFPRVSGGHSSVHNAAWLRPA